MYLAGREYGDFVLSVALTLLCLSFLRELSSCGSGSSGRSMSRDQLNILQDKAPGR